MADEFLQFIPGDTPGTIRSSYDSDFVPQDLTPRVASASFPGQMTKNKRR